MECEENGCKPACMRGCPEGCLNADSEADDGPGLDAKACEEWCRTECEQTCKESCGSTDWLSHPLHADANPADCDMLDDGVCVRRLPDEITAFLHPISADSEHFPSRCPE